MRPTLDDMEHPAYRPLLRWLANLIRLPALCARAKCRRAQACRGEPHRCLTRYAPLLPEDALAGAEALLDGKIRGLSFDAVRNDNAAVHDLVAWRQRAG
jgi:hypothetical protein